MKDHHARFEELAVGHVLGGLPAADAAAFRDHLGGCRICRSRVAELRSIADDLAAAERDERAQAAVRTEVPRRADEDPAGPEPAARIGIRHVTLAVVAVAMLATAMGFWNLHLRTTSASYFATAEARGATLQQLAAGSPLEVETAGVATALAALDGDTLAVTVDGIAPLDAETWLVAWFRGEPTGERARVLARPGGLPEGAIAFSDDVGEATELVITREPQQGSSVPTTPPIVRVPLP
jgi:anti-sigma factor RsiW